MVLAAPNGNAGVVAPACAGPAVVAFCQPVCRQFEVPTPGVPPNVMFRLATIVIDESVVRPTFE